MLLIFLVSLVLSQTCKTPINIDEISTTHFAEETHNLETEGVKNKWSCQQVDSEVHEEKAMTFSFTVKTTGLYELSTCNSQTDFSSRIIIGKSCTEEVASNCVGANDGDPNGVCDGHRSRVIASLNSGVVYYTVIAGVTENDFGTFKLTIKPYNNPSSIKCSLALNIGTVPNSVNGLISSSQQYFPTKHGFKRGFWFKFTATQKTHIIDTCNKNTQYGTTIYLYKNPTTSKECMSDMPIVESSEGCGSFAKLYYDNYEVGSEYYAFVFFTEDVSGTNQLEGSLEISFRLNGGENYKCQNAFAISKKPFSILIDMKGQTNNSSPCALNTPATGMYFALRGDNRRYAFHTCYTESTGNDKTSIEFYKDGCANCASTSTQSCGNDAIVTAFLELNKIYRFRVVCSNPECKVNINLLQLDNVDNHVCDKAREVKVAKDEQYSQFMMGSSVTEYTSFKCPGAPSDVYSKDMKGGWYKLKSEEDIDIVHGVFALKNTHYRAFMATFDDCEKDCKLMRTKDAVFVSDTLKKGKDLYVFASSVREAVWTGPQYGAFMYWMLAKESLGHTFSDAYEVSSPYSGIFPLGPALMRPLCTHQSFPNLGQIAGLIVKYTNTNSKTLTISTCGTETLVPTIMDIVSETNGKQSCSEEVETLTCGNGNTITSALNGTSYATVFVHPSYTVTEGVVRLNIYENTKEASSRCTAAEEVTVPSVHYSYTEKADSTRGNCLILADGLKGKWFTFTSEKDVSLMIKTDDISTFNTQIGVYDSCEVVAEDSVAGKCVTGTNFIRSPVGIHGTLLTFEAKKNKKYFIFVGGALNSDSGFMRVVFDYYDEDGLTGGQIFGIVFAVVFLVIIIAAFAAFVGYLGYKKYQSKHNASTFGTF
ncbi:hypothetical protein EIN_186070 [Entamoeba invadens IP1]|uniref:hypothetical protein n=1 Tax=Entamoeba invadens IP1 TaxID=370355 RepID=UPI0002C3F900|nr:hypothetical protein EIN_186070 [Entamoeba invadens IP1]ELP94190.1 hypothetical protein EIN_186070 [Entamoeba invadens IP1]|eukprot:XP_004260961.1 hypothetical protein EIN_186070 [Entamoeba invadens IP1]